MSAMVFLLLCLIWGTTWIAIKLGLEGAPPLYAAGIRFLIAVSILSVIVKLKRRTYPTQLRGWLTLAHPGVYMYGMSYALVYFGEQRIDSALAAVLFGSYPLFVAMLSSFYLKKEPIRGLAWIGLAAGFAGVILISYESLNLSHSEFLGSMLTLLGSFASAAGLILHKRTCAHNDIYTAAAVQMGAGAALLLLGAILTEDISQFVVSSQSLGSILYLAVLGSVVAFLGYYWLLTHTRAVAVSMVAFVTPVIAIMVGIFLFHETLSLLIFGGAAMILAGIVLVVRE